MRKRTVSVRWRVIGVFGGYCFFFGIATALAQAPLHPGLEIINHASSAIRDIYAKPSGSPKWGSKLQESAIAAGASREVKVPSETNCSYDIRVVYENGHAEEHAGADICQRARIVFEKG
jgi:hypothetical protein